jgi:hypothetical protein
MLEVDVVSAPVLLSTLQRLVYDLLRYKVAIPSCSFSEFNLLFYLLSQCLGHRASWQIRNALLMLF